MVLASYSPGRPISGNILAELPEKQALEDNWREVCCVAREPLTDGLLACSLAHEGCMMFP